MCQALAKDFLTKKNGFEPRRTMPVDLSVLSPAESAALGTCAGAATKIVNYPILAWKNASQQGLPLPRDPRVVYRGTATAVVNLSSTTAIQFWLTGTLQRQLSAMVKANGKQRNRGDLGRSSGSSDTAVKLSGAFLGGLLSGIPCSLLELTMIQQQRFGGTVASTPLRIVRERGSSVLLRGMATTMARESLFTLAMLGTTPFIQQSLREQYGMGSDQALVIGSLASSFVAATSTHPLDTIKTCMQGDVQREKYRGFTATGRALVQEYGATQGLFKAYTWRMGLIACSFFLVNRFKEAFAPTLFPHLARDQEED
jgi:solute carrier family 25 (mitochondrial carnitine/acylcarnitine transporter), member 20/29